MDTEKAKFNVPRTNIQRSEDVVILAEEFNKLSAKEREQALADIHGVAETVEEEPQFVQGCLEKLESALDSIKFKPAYEKALFLNPRYVHNREFRMAFLRAEKFDASLAAIRMVEHFELKLDLFGYEKLARDIVFDDLTTDDQEMVLEGQFYVLDQYDRSGRRIALNIGERALFKRADNYVSFSSI